MSGPIISPLILSAGQFRADGNRFVGWGANVCTWALVDQPGEVTAMFERMKQAGCNAVRFHHMDFLGSNTWFHADSTTLHPRERIWMTDQLDEAYMVRLDHALIACQRLGLRVWLDLWNRWQMTGADLRRFIDGGDYRVRECFDAPMFGSQPGELRSYVFLFEELQRAVSEHAIRVLSRINTISGVRYADDPTISWLLIANEHDFENHSLHFWVGSPIKTAYQQAWVDSYRAFLRETGLGDSKPTLERWKGFHSAQVFGAIRRTISNEFPAWGGEGRRPIISHSMWGDNPWSCLPSIASASDAVDLHVYCQQRETDPNLMSDRTDRRWLPTLETLIAGHRLENRPLTISEWGPVIQATTRIEPRLSTADCVDACDVVARACIRQDVDAAFLFAWQQGPASLKWCKDEKYNFGVNREIVAAFQSAGQMVLESDRRLKTLGMTEMMIDLGPRELYGTNLNRMGGYHRPSAWSEPYLRDAMLNNRRVRLSINPT